MTRRTKSPRFRPSIERLEDRTVPAILMVTNLSDSGAGSLRAELAAAQGGDTVRFDPALHSTITLTSGELALRQSVTVEGPGASVLSVSGNNASRVFEVFPGVNATLRALTATRGAVGAQNGGGVLVDGGGTLTLTACTLSYNSATAGGGGIYNAGTLTLTACTLSYNGSLVTAGAIYNAAGSLTLTACTLSGNGASNGNPVLVGSGSLTLTACTLAYNSEGLPGCIRNLGGAVLLRNTIVAYNSSGGFDEAINGSVSPASSCNLIGG